jgi:uncharacterized membrane protein
MTMKKIRKTVSIKAPLNLIYEYMTHPENLPEIWPSMVEVTHTTRKADGSHSFDWIYKMAGMHFRGHAVTIEVKQNERVVVKNEKGIASTFIWTYAGENGGTKVTMEVEYSLPSHLLEKLAEPFLHGINEREAQTVLENLKSRMELGVKSVASKQETHAHPK